MIDPNPAIAREKRELAALLHLPGMSAARLRKLVSLFGSPAGAWEALRRGASDGSGGVAGSWRAASRSIDPDALESAMSRSGIGLVTRGDPGYPPLLRTLQNPDPPLALFYRGELSPEITCVAIVGARKATPYGVEAANWLSGELARAGLCVVSGAAYGIDSAAHGGALSAGGRTCAVLGCGVDVVYPRRSEKLLEEIASSGCIISEYPPGAHPSQYTFPERNRIIAGMSVAVVVVEAAQRSGALITADFALSQGREVLGVPGQIFSTNSRGTHDLIRSGAAIATCPEDVLAQMGLPVAAGPPAASSADAERLAREEELLLERLEAGPLDVESLSGAADLPAPAVVALLGSLEIRGLVRREVGGRYQARPPAGRPRTARPKACPGTPT